MPMISFSGETSQGPFWEQIRAEKKTQTVRRPRKRPICEGDTLHLYWKVRVPKDKKPIHLIHTAVCTRVRRLIYIEFAFDDAFAKRDGFRDHHELQEWFGNPFLHPGTEYVVVEWRLLYSLDIEKKLQSALDPVKELYPDCSHCGVRCGIDNADQWICRNCNRILGQATPEEAQAIAQALYGMEVAQE